MTKPLPDLPTAARFVAARYGRRAADVQPLGEGAWSRAFALTLDGVPRVIRFGWHADDFAKDAAVAAIASGMMPVPAVVDLGADALGCFAVSERVRGQFIDDVDRATLDAVLPSLLRALDVLAGLRPPAAAGFGNWTPDRGGEAASWRAFLLAVGKDDPAARIHGWRDRLARMPGALEAFGAGWARLCELVPDVPERRGLVHADLLHRNVMADGGQVSGIIDWGSSLIGDPWYDVAWLLFWSVDLPSWSGVPVALLRYHRWLDRSNVPTDHRLLAYLLHIGLSSMAYSAFVGHDADVALEARRIADVLRGRPPHPAAYRGGS